MLHIVPARAEDAGELSRIAFEAKGHWGYSQEWMESWRTSLTIDPEYILANPVYLGRDPGGVCGFYALTGESPALTLDHLWMDPTRMGQGYGRALFEHAVQRARELGAARLDIQADPHAEGFYLHMGAQRCGEMKYRLGGQERVLPLLVYSV
ncbi:MAG: GNAT family N-acetyltransferase [Chloroflexi bacterium]|nr:GNAT family N-acetyltransferase [Chloroflexota bacterium]